MDTPLHDKDRLPLQVADHKASGMPMNCRFGPVGQVAIRDNIRFLNGIGKVIQAGTKNDSDAWSLLGAFADRLCRLINLFERDVCVHMDFIFKSKKMAQALPQFPCAAKIISELILSRLLI